MSDACQDSFPHIAADEQQHEISAINVTDEEETITLREFPWPVWWDIGTRATPEDWHILGCWSRTEEASSCCWGQWSITAIWPVLCTHLKWRPSDYSIIIGKYKRLSGCEIKHQLVFCVAMWLTLKVFQLVRRTAPCCLWGRSPSWGLPETMLPGEELISSHICTFEMEICICCSWTSSDL